MDTFRFPEEDCADRRRYLTIHPPCVDPHNNPDFAYVQRLPIVAMTGTWGMPIHPFSQTPFTTRHERDNNCTASNMWYEQ